MRQNITNVIREKCKDGEKHRIKTTGLPRLWIDNVEVYRCRGNRPLFLVAMGIGFAVGLLLRPIVFYLGKYILNLLF